MTNYSKSDLLTLGHLQELQQACLFERSQSEGLRSEVSNLREAVGRLETNIKIETMRYFYFAML